MLLLSPNLHMMGVKMQCGNLNWIYISAKECVNIFAELHNEGVSSMVSVHCGLVNGHVNVWMSIKENPGATISERHPHTFV